MNVLLVGRGGREHALAWKLAQSRRLGELYIAPGNAGTASAGTNLPLEMTDIDGLLRAASDHAIDLTIVGQEAPLALGLTDAFNAAGLKVFGPTRAAARIESSKVFAKKLMQEAGIPTPRHTRVSTFDQARAHIMAMPEDSLVVKADGLAQGKGVTVAGSREEAIEAAKAMMVDRVFGEAASEVLLEERAEGPEVSVFAFVDGATVSNEVAACDYKRAFDGDMGPNTGGMGAYSPPEFWDEELAGRVRQEILQPIAEAMVEEGCPFKGVIYAALMLTKEGPTVLEFNCRFGDPEAEVVMPRLQSDLLEVCLAVAEGRLTDMEVTWGGRPHVGVVVASGGYPGSYTAGLPISGLEETARQEGVLVFHAGAHFDDHHRVVTAGGRVLIAVGSGSTTAAARATAYSAARGIRFKGATWRTDIAARAVEAEAAGVTER